MSVELLHQMQAAMQMRGYSAKTQSTYLHAVRQLSASQDCPLDHLTREQLQQYFLNRRNRDHWAANSLRIRYYGVRFLYTQVLAREWPKEDLIGTRHERRLPSVLSVSEVRRLLRQVSVPGHRVFLTLVYACGLRLSEARYLRPSDIDADRRLIHVHGGKCARDRLVPLPDAPARLLRDYCNWHRNPGWLFPSTGRGRRSGEARRAQSAIEPMSVTSVQSAMKRACAAAGIGKRQVSVHTLRHSYATHLLDAGVPLPTIQRYLGHSQIQSTLLYLHLTTQGQEAACARIQALMSDLG